MPRKKMLLYTAFNSFAIFALGVRISIRGPVLTDILAISGTDIQGGSFYFIFSNFGYMLGSLMAGAAYGRVKTKSILIVGGLLLSAVFTVLTPWCESFVSMLAIHIIISISLSVFETVINTEEVRSWKGQSEAAMQFLSFCYSFGGIIGPLIAKPFLSPKPGIQRTFTNKSQNNSIESTQISDILPLFQNKTRLYNEHLSLDSETLNSSGLSDDTSTPGSVFDESLRNQTMNQLAIGSKIHYAFIISGSLFVLASIPFIILWIGSRIKKRVSRIRNNDRLQSSNRRPVKVYIFLTALISMFYFCFTAIDDVFVQFVAFFVVEHADWTKESGALVTSLYWGPSTCVKLLLVFMMTRIDMGVVLLLSSVGMVISSFLFVLASQYYLHSLIWISTASLALSTSAIQGGGFSWMDSNLLQVDGRVTTSIMIMSSVGAMVTPLPLVVLMKDWSLMAFPSMIALLCFVLAITFVCMLWIVKPTVIKKYGPPRFKEEQACGDLMPTSEARTPEKQDKNGLDKKQEASENV